MYINCILQIVPLKGAQMNKSGKEIEIVIATGIQMTYKVKLKFPNEPLAMVHTYSCVVVAYCLMLFAFPPELVRKS
jgi:hypothetical protein